MKWSPRTRHPRPSDSGYAKSPDGLMVTAPSKMRYARTIRVTFNDSTAETITFRRDVIENNLGATERLVSTLGPHFVASTSKERPTRIWRNVPADVIRTFLTQYRTHPDAVKADSIALGKFIQASNADGELIDWTVALISVSAGRLHVLGGHSVGLVEREGIAVDAANLTIRRVVSPGDETLDLSEEERARAVERTIESWRAAGKGTREPTVPIGWAVREQRARERALLLLYPLAVKSGEDRIGPVLGFAISFPKASSDKEIEYAANQVYWASEYGWENQL